MWPKGTLFCCLSFFFLPLLAHKCWDQYREDQNLISRLRIAGVL